MASIKKHAANFDDHERVDAYNQLTDAMERISAIYDAFDVIALDVSKEADAARFTYYAKLSEQLERVAQYADVLSNNAKRNVSIL